MASVSVVSWLVMGLASAPGDEPEEEEDEEDDSETTPVSYSGGSQILLHSFTS